MQHGNDGTEENEAAAIAKVIADECVAMRVRFLNRVVTNRYDRFLKPLDLKIGQAGILVLLAVCGEATATDIGRILQMEKSTVSRNVGRMRKKNWLEVTGKEGGLSQNVKITPKGRELLAAFHDEWAKAQKATKELLGEEGVASVHRLYDTVRSEG